METMRLNFIQYGSPIEKDGGYCWIITNNLQANVCAEFLEKYRIIRADKSYSGCGMMLLKNNIGIVFKDVKVRDYSGRIATLTNGLVFDLRNARKSGINGIWELPQLEESKTDINHGIIEFSPAFIQYPDTSFQVLLNALEKKQEALFAIKKVNSIFKIEKVESMGESEEIELPPSSSIPKEEPLPMRTNKNNYKIHKITISYLLIGFICLLIGFICGTLWEIIPKINIKIKINVEQIIDQGNNERQSAHAKNELINKEK